MPPTKTSILLATDAFAAGLVVARVITDGGEAVAPEWALLNPLGDGRNVRV